MNTESKNKLMMWAIVTLAILNLATIASVLYYRNRDRQGRAIQEAGPIHSENASIRFSGRYFRDQLNLNARQMEKFREFNSGFRQEVRNINLELSNIRRKMLDEMASPDYDTVRLNSLADSVGQLHAYLKVLTYRYYLDFNEICSKDQKEKLNSLFGDLFVTDVHAGQYKAGTYGRGRGRRFTN